MNTQDKSKKLSVATVAILSLAMLVLSTVAEAKPPPKATICGVKFHDKDADGVKDPMEGGLKNWEIKLYKFEWSPSPHWDYVKKANTGNDGSYCFDVCKAGKYKVTEVLKPGWNQTAPPTGCYELDVKLGEDYKCKNFGNVECPATICGVKFDDQNADGVKDPNEGGLKNWKIELWKGPSPTWVKVDTETTGDDGSYCFTVTQPGTYRVKEVTKSGWKQTAPAPPGYYEFCVKMCEDYSKNFGNIKLGSISGYKFHAVIEWDVDPEYPLEGWEIHLTGTDILSNPVDETKYTNSEGKYKFKKLLPGTYTAEEIFPPPPAVWVPVTDTSYTYDLSVGENYVGPKFVNKHEGPVVITDPATNVGEISATLNGRIGNDGGDFCEWRFDWWSSEFSASCGMGGALTTGQSFQLPIDGLKPGTLHYFRACARNSGGFDWGNIQSFTTLPGCEGTVLLLDPNGGQELIAGSIYEITWETTDTIENVLLEYSTDNGTNWTVIDTVSNTGLYEWLVPQENSQQCLVRISGEGCPEENDTSDDVFTVYQCALAFDLNHDCVVDDLDVDLLMSEFGMCGNPFDPNCLPLAGNSAGESQDNVLSFTTPGFPTCHPDYDEWVAVGKPDCWFYPRQCHGDADGQKQGSAHAGYTYVAFDDLAILIDAWQIKDPPHGPGLSGDQICADFDHARQGNASTGYMRVSADDLAILINYWRVKEPPDGLGTDPNCLDCP